MRRLVAVLLIVATGAVAAPSAQAAPPRCNGLAELCDRPLGAVAFPTSHNSMSSAADGFRGPNQGATMAEQLDDGIRGFQIDAYLGSARGDRVYTDVATSVPAQTDLPEPLLQAGLRLHDRLASVPADGTSKVYLCHTLCELGAITMRSAFDDVARFLDEHPDEVLLFVVEDYVQPDRLLAVLDAAGLHDELLPVPSGSPLPTLGEMLDAGKRLVVTLENGDAPPLLPNAFAALVEETPFTFHRIGDLRTPASCVDNRGVTDAPIFQLNHWVTPAGPRRSRVVNFAVLRDRVAECTELRGRAPTLVAVDFAEDSAVLEVSRSINRAER